MGLSERTGCLIVGEGRTMVRWRSCRSTVAERRGRLRELASQSMTWSACDSVVSGSVMPSDLAAF